MLQNVVLRILASIFVVAGSAAIVLWLWPNGADTMRLFRVAIAVVSAGVALIVLASLWKR
jgi:hypothetical protein